MTRPDSPNLQNSSLLKKVGKTRLGLYLFLLPLFFWGIALFAVQDALLFWIRGEVGYEQNILKEWLEEARIFRKSLPGLIKEYKKLLNSIGSTNDDFSQNLKQAAIIRREEIHQHLRALGEPATKIHPDILPLFPTFYEIKVSYTEEPDKPIFWSSGLPFQPGQCQKLEYAITEGAVVQVYYQLHAYDKRWALEKEKMSRGRWLFIVGALLALILTIQAFITYFREKTRWLQSQQAFEAAEFAEKKLLAQQLAAKAAEKDVLELRSQMFAGVGIMAGSYAHNIKNLLVRPLDLLRRCVSNKNLDTVTVSLLGEVEQTLGSVSERLAQILRTVRRQDDKFEPIRFDVVDLVSLTILNWKNLADDKWKIDLDLIPNPQFFTCFIKADPSHIQQVLENFIFNARDAVFEKRVTLRDSARNNLASNPLDIKNSILEAAAWRGKITFSFSLIDSFILLNISDNGAGMSEEVIDKCTQPYFSTRRDSAIFEGQGSGMGLGLSFIKSVLDKSNGTMVIHSQKGQGTSFSIQFNVDPF